MGIREERFPSGKDYWFSFYLILCFLLMALSFQFPSLNRNFQLFIVESTTPVVDMMRLPRLWAVSFSSNVSDYIGVMDENEALKKKLSTYMSSRQEYDILLSENNQLKILLDMSEDVAGEPLAVRVKMDPLSPFNRSVLVGEGALRGVIKGQEVLGEGGIVGRVVDVFPHYSRVLLATDYTFRVPVKILETRVRGIARGTNGRYLELMLLEEDAAISPNMTVVTTGAGDVFSEDVLVGVVRRMNGRLMVEPEVDFSTMDIVSIQRRKVPGILDLSSESKQEVAP